MQQQAAGREGGRAGDVEDKRKAGRAGDVEDKRKAGRAGDVEDKRKAGRAGDVDVQRAAKKIERAHSKCCRPPTPRSRRRCHHRCNDQFL